MFLAKQNPFNGKILPEAVLIVGHKKILPKAALIVGCRKECFFDIKKVFNDSFLTHMTWQNVIRSCLNCWFLMKKVMKRLKKILIWKLE